jgi:putative Holliday junction resolvase
MSLDLGAVRTGFAICDKFEILAYPLCVVSEKNRKTLINIIVSKVLQNLVEMIVVGYPINMDETHGKSAKQVEKFVLILKKKLNKIKIVLWDERLTTVVASKRLANAKVYGEKRKKIIDSVSAVEILQSFIDYKNSFHGMTK